MVYGTSLTYSVAANCEFSWVVSVIMFDLCYKLGFRNRYISGLILQYHTNTMVLVSQLSSGLAE